MSRCKLYSVAVVVGIFCILAECVAAGRLRSISEHAKHAHNGKHTTAHNRRQVHVPAVVAVGGSFAEVKTRAGGVQLIESGTCAANQCTPVITEDECKTAAKGALPSMPGALHTVCPNAANKVFDSPICTQAPAGCYAEYANGAVTSLHLNANVASAAAAELFVSGDTSSGRKAICNCASGDTVKRDSNTHTIGTCGRIPILDAGTISVVENAEQAELAKQAGLVEATGNEAFLKLKCAEGHTLLSAAQRASGAPVDSRYGLTTIWAFCSTTSVLTIKDETGQNLETEGGKVSPCKPIQCPVFVTVLHATADGIKGQGDDDEEWVDIMLETEYFHGHGGPTIKCDLGHTVGGLPPAEDESNTKTSLTCDAGAYHHGSGEFDAIECQPVECPQDQPIWSNALLRDGVINTEYGGPVTTIECQTGYALCTEMSDSVTCTAESHESLDLSCQAEGTWLGSTDVAKLTCKPVECKALPLGEDRAAYAADTGGGISKEKSEENMKWYSFNGFNKEFFVEVTCSQGWTMDGTVSGQTLALFTCAEDGLMRFSNGDSPLEGPPCKPVGCAVIAHVGHGHKEAKMEEKGDGESLTLTCEDKHSYDALGRHSAAETSNFARELLCTQGKYDCKSGFCRYKEDKAHLVNCKPIQCTVPTRPTLEEKNIEWAPIAALLAEEQRAVITRDVGEMISLRCAHGFTRAEQAGKGATVKAVCQETWEKPEDAWKPAIVPCTLDPTYCEEVPEATWKARFVATWDQGTARSLNSERKITCDKGYTLREEQPEKIEQTQTCQDPSSVGRADARGEQEAYTGVWHPAHKGCVKVRCVAPSMIVLKAGSVEGGGDCGHSLCATYDSTISYTCEPGYRFAVPEYPEASPIDKPQEVAMKCTETGDMVITAPEEWVAKKVDDPRCIPVMCAQSNQDWLEAMQATMADKPSFRGLQLLRDVYTWTGSTAQGQGLGRHVGSDASLRCNDGPDEYSMRCGATGNFEVSLADTWQPIEDTVPTLLLRCGKALEVRDSVQRDSQEKMCMTAVKANEAVAVKKCVGSDSQQWWFDKHGADCSGYGRVNSDGTAVHRWHYCGKVRSLSLGAEFKDMCLSPPEADKQGSAPVLKACIPENEWLLNVDTEAFMLWRGDQDGESTAVQQRYNVFVSAGHEGGGLQAEVDQYFVQSKEAGFVATAASSSENVVLED